MVDELSALKKFALKQVPGDDDTKQARLWAVLFVSAIKILLRKGGLGSLCRSQGSLSAKHLTDKNIAAADLRALVDELYTRFADVLDEDTAEAIKLTSLVISDDCLQNVWAQAANKRLSRCWDNELSLGYLYQFFAIPQRKKSQTDIATADKALSLSQLIAFTQLYTPSWVVEFLLQNTLLPCWSSPQAKCDAGPSFDYQLNGSSETQKDARHLRLLDPSCGAGHFLLPAFDLMLNLYKMEGVDQVEAIESILNNNLFGADIDATAIAVAKLSLLVRCLNLGLDKSVKASGLTFLPQTTDTPDLLGSLKRDWSTDHIFNLKFDAVVMNPPYIGRKLLDRKLKSELKSLYPDAYNDLCAAFLYRGLELLAPGGRLGVIGQSSLLYLQSYEELRKYFAESTSLVCVVDAGLGVFPLLPGEKVNSVLLVAEAQGKAKNNDDGNATFIDLTKSVDKKDDLKQIIHDSAAVPASSAAGFDSNVAVAPAGACSAKQYLAKPQQFQHHRHYAYNYKCPLAVVKLMHDLLPLSSVAEIRQGLATTNNSRFVRFWWDVEADSIGKRWFPYMKGAGGQRWVSGIHTVVDWQDNGQAIKETVARTYPYLKGKVDWVVKNEQYYFRPGLTFSFVNSGQFAVRILPPGCIFDVSGSALFFADDDLYFWLAYLNSSVVSAFACVLNPTINFQVGDIKRLPLIPLKADVREELAHLAKQCYELTNYLNSLDPSVLGAGLLGEIQAVVSGGDIEAVWNDYQFKRQSTAAQILQCESRIDELIEMALFSTAHDLGIASNDLHDLRLWLLDNQRNESRQLLGPLDEEQFARLVLHELIARVLPLSLPIGDDKAIADRIGLNEVNAKWLQKKLALSISKYVQTEFALDHRKYFKQSPRYFCLSNHQSLQLFSSAHVRNGNGHTSSAPDGIGETLSRLAAHAASVSDWTGADLARMIESAVDL